MGYTSGTYRNISALITVIGDISNASGQSCDSAVSVADVVAAMKTNHWMSKPTVYRTIRAARTLELVADTQGDDPNGDRRHGHIRLTDMGTTDYHAQHHPIPREARNPH